MPHSLLVPFVPPVPPVAVEPGPSIPISPISSHDPSIVTVSGVMPPADSDPSSATGSAPGCKVGPPSSHRTFHTPNVFTSVAAPEVTHSTVSPGLELLTLSPTASRDSPGLNFDIDALQDIKNKIHLVGAAPFALLRKQGMPCYVLQICPKCPDVVSDSVSSSLHSASHILSTTNLTEDKSSLFAKIIPPEYHDFNDIFLKADALPLPPH